MAQISRRNFLKLGAGLGSLGLLGLPSVSFGAAAKVVVIGGGSGGATAARYLKRYDPSIEVTLIERNETYYTCYMSNEVLASERTLEQIAFG